MKLPSTKSIFIINDEDETMTQWQQATKKKPFLIIDCTPWQLHLGNFLVAYMRNKGWHKPLFFYPPNPWTRCGLGGKWRVFERKYIFQRIGQDIEKFLCLLLPKVGYWVLFPYVTNFTVTKVIICFQLNLKIEQGCITLLSSKQPSSAHPSSHEALQMTVTIVQCSSLESSETSHSTIESFGSWGD